MLFVMIVSNIQSALRVFNCKYMFLDVMCAESDFQSLVLDKRLPC